MNTPHPPPDERANGWRTEYPYPSGGWSAPDPDQATQGAEDTQAPFGGPAVGRAYVPAPPFPHEPLVRGRELIAALGVAVFLALAGFPLGWLWSAVAPGTPVQMVADGAVLSQPEQEQMIADEGWYVFLTVIAGVLVAALVWAFLRRYRGVPMVAGLAIGAVVGGCVAAWFGHHIGYAHFRELVAHAPVGTNFLAPVNLRVKTVGWWHHVVPYARGDVLARASAALLVYLLLAAFSAYPSLRQPDPAPPVNFASGNGYPVTAYPATAHGDQFGEVGPGTTYPTGTNPGGPISSDS